MGRMIYIIDLLTGQASGFSEHDIKSFHSVVEVIFVVDYIFE